MRGRSLEVDGDPLSRVRERAGVRASATSSKRGPSVLVLLLTIAACSGTADEPASRRDRATRTEGTAEGTPREVRAPVRTRSIDDVPPLQPSTYPAPARLVAIGDVHGDMQGFRAALRLAGAVDLADHWSGGDLFVVQVGDLLDRGDDEPEILALVTRLEREAAEVGGHFVTIQGNHEVMNAQLDFRYVTPDGFRDYDRFRDEASREARRAVPRQQVGRAGAFEPRSQEARAFAVRNTVIVVGDTVFVHGGVTPEVAALGLDTINQAARDFYLGRPLSPLLASETSPIWHRGYAVEGSPETCAQLREALVHLHADRMVIGHTVQEGGVNAACDEQVWRIDVGLARYYDGPIEVLEISGGATRILRGTR